jgi:hypothetical protein
VHKHSYENFYKINPSNLNLYERLHDQYHPILMDLTCPHMVMENKHMVDEDGVGDDDSEEALEIPLSGVESRIMQLPKMKIAMVTLLWVS